MHADPLVPEQGLWRTPRALSLGLCPFLSAICAGRGASGETEVWGHGHPLGQVEDGWHLPVSRAGAALGAHLHVRGRRFLIYSNKHLRCASDLSVCPLGPWTASLVRHLRYTLGQVPAEAGCAQCAGCRHGYRLPPRPQEHSQPALSFSLFTVDVTVTSVTAHSFNPRCAAGRGWGIQGYHGAGAKCVAGRGRGVCDRTCREGSRGSSPCCQGHLRGLEQHS